jgi:hypothetical protein
VEAFGETFELQVRARSHRRVARPFFHFRPYFLIYLVPRAPGSGSVAPPRCATTRPLYTIFANAFGSSISEAPMRMHLLQVLEVKPAPAVCIIDTDLSVDFAPAVRTCQGRLSALSVFHGESVLYGAYLWARGVLNRQKRRFPARADARRRRGRRRLQLRPRG